MGCFYGLICFGKTFITSVSDMAEIRKAIKSAFIMDFFIAMENGDYFIAYIKEKNAECFIHKEEQKNWAWGF